jgi:cullin 1
MSENMSNEDLLQFYTDQWDKYRKTINALQFVFSYLHRHWIQVAHIRGFKSIHEINIVIHIYCLLYSTNRTIFLVNHVNMARSFLKAD